jgi:hypothetical protein
MPGIAGGNTTYDGRNERKHKLPSLDYSEIFKEEYSR